MKVILVVSGEGRIGRHVRSVLGSQGWWVTTAAGREEALRASADHQPALVIVDSEVEGAGELVRTFGSKNGGPGVLLLEAADGEDHSFGAYEAGADQILSKPPRAQALIEAADRVMSLPHQSSGSGAFSLGQKLSSEDIFGDLLTELGENVPPHRNQHEEPIAGEADGAGTELAGETAILAEAQVDAQAEAGTDAEAEIEVEAEAGTDPSSEAEVELDAQAEAVSELRAEADADAEIEADADAEVEIEAQVASDSELQLEPDIDIEAVVETSVASDFEDEPHVEAGAASAIGELEEGSAGGPAVAAPVETGLVEPDAVERDLVEPVSADLPASTAEGAETVLQPDRSADERVSKVEGSEDREASRELDADLAIEEVEPPTEERASDAGFIVDPAVEELVAQLRPSADDTDLENRVESVPEDGLREEEEAVEAGSAEAMSQGAAEPMESAASGESIEQEDGPVEDSVTPPVLIERADGEEERRFGQYRLDERIAVGGMAEVWRASMLGMEGFRKTVAIKKILPHLAENSEFVTMFIEEAKLAARLTHENLVEIYDLGRIGASYFIAMEYVDGRDLRSLLNRLRQRSEQMPIGLALLVGAEVSRGLEYAHTRQDGDGNPMGLVHRDVSPRNVLLGHDGRVRLCDFGVAKAVSSVIQTEIGALKGKLQYMSPEQASGKPVDARSDIYSLGSVMYEMITGRRLYEADNEISLLDAVRAGSFEDPRKHCPGLPQEVRRILLKALAKRPAARYQTAGAMGQELATLVRTLDPVPSEQQLSGFVSGLFAEPPVESEAGLGDFATASTGAGGDSALQTRSVVVPAPPARSKVVRFWWGVVAGLLAAGLVAGGIKLLLG